MYEQSLIFLRDSLTGEQVRVRENHLEEQVCTAPRDTLFFFATHAASPRGDSQAVRLSLRKLRELMLIKSNNVLK